MEQGTPCSRHGEHCTGWARDSRGVPLVFKTTSVRVKLCGPCEAELAAVLAPFMDGLPKSRWPKSTLREDSRGLIWDDAERRAALELLGHGHVIPRHGVLGSRAENIWWGLVENDPGLLEQVRAHMSAEVAAAIREQVERNREG